MIRGDFREGQEQADMPKHGRLGLRTPAASW